MSAALLCLDLSGGPALSGSQGSCPSWISVVLPLLDLSGPAPPLDLSGPALPGSQGSYPAWILVALPLLDLSGPALLDLSGPALLDLSGPALPQSQWPCPA